MTTFRCIQKKMENEKVEGLLFVHTKSRQASADYRLDSQLAAKP